MIRYCLYTPASPLFFYGIYARHFNASNTAIVGMMPLPYYDIEGVDSEMLVLLHMVGISKQS